MACGFIMINTRAFVLGNGQSRLNIDLNKLKDKGIVFGCNALYRDFTPHVLVATDPEISEEIINSKYDQTNEFWTRHPKGNAHKININFGYSSGPVAVTLAAHRNHKPIFLIGFDLIGNKGRINNIYAGTSCYRDKNANETYWGNWDRQLTSIMVDQYPRTKFVRVVDKGGYSPNTWKSLKNYREISTIEFQYIINNMSWQKQNE